MENIPEEGVKYSQGCSEMYRLDKIERSAKIFTVFKEKDLAGFHLKGCDRKEPFMLFFRRQPSESIQLYLCTWTVQCRYYR